MDTFEAVPGDNQIGWYIIGVCDPGNGFTRFNCVKYKIIGCNLSIIASCKQAIASGAVWNPKVIPGDQFITSQIVDFKEGCFVNVVAPANAGKVVSLADNMCFVASAYDTVQARKVGLRQFTASQWNLNIIMTFIQGSFPRF